MYRNNCQPQQNTAIHRKLTVYFIKNKIISIKFLKNKPEFMRNLLRKNTAAFKYKKEARFRVLLPKRKIKLLNKMNRLT